MRVEFCSTNMDLDGSRLVFDRLKREFPDLAVLEFGCLGNCEQCAGGPYCIVGGRLVQASDPEELWRKVLAVIAQLSHRT